MPSSPPFPLVLGLAFLLSPALLGTAAAQGAPRAVSECERLKNDLAYNQCLSMFGPAAKNVAAGDGTASSTATAAALPPVMPGSLAAIPTVKEPEQEVRRGRRFRRGSYGRGGRQSASFSVGGGETRSYRRHRRRR